MFTSDQESAAHAVLLPIARDRGDRGATLCLWDVHLGDPEIDWDVPEALRPYASKVGRAIHAPAAALAAFATGHPMPDWLLPDPTD